MESGRQECIKGRGRGGARERKVKIRATDMFIRERRENRRGEERGESSVRLSGVP